MRVCMFVWNFWPGPQGGTERQCWKQAQEVVQNGVECTIVTRWPILSAYRYEIVSGVHIRRIGIISPFFTLLSQKFHKVRKRVRRSFPKEAKSRGDSSSSKIMLPRKRDVLSLFRFMEYLLFMIEVAFYLYTHRKTIDIIHSHGGCWMSGYLLYLGKKCGIPTIAKEGVFPVFRSSSLDVPFSKKWDILRISNNYIAIHDFVRTGLINAGVSVNSIYLIPNGVEIPKEFAHLDSQIVLMVANFSQGAIQKGFDVLFDAWTKVIERVPSAQLWLVGDGDTTFWMALCSERNIQKSVRFVGFVNQTNEYYKRASVFVLPSRLEGLSNALLEAQSWGLPSVVSDIPGNRIVVEDGVNGLLVEVGDSSALSNSLIYILENHLIRKQMGNHARTKTENYFSIQAVGRKLISTYSLEIKRSKAFHG